MSELDLGRVTGKSAHETAKDGGYTGTEAEFNAILAIIDKHASRHKAGGADPLTAADVGAAPVVSMSKMVSVAGWYKIGTMRGSDTAWHTSAATVYVGGGFNNNQPTTAIVDIVCGYDQFQMILLACAAHEGIIKLGLIKTTASNFDIFAYYKNSASNQIKVDVEFKLGSFESADLEATTLGDADMDQIVNLTERINPPMQLGVEYRTTERWNGKPVYTRLVDCGIVGDFKIIELPYAFGSITLLGGRGISDLTVMTYRNVKEIGYNTSYNFSNQNGKVTVELTSTEAMYNANAILQLWFVKN